MGEPVDVFDEHYTKPLNLDKLIDGYDVDDDFNDFGLALNTDLSHWHIPKQDISDTGSPSDSKQNRAQGNKRAKLSEGSIQGPGCSGLEDASVHAQIAPNKAKSSSTAFKPCLPVITTNSPPLTNWVPRIYCQAPTTAYVEDCASTTGSSQDLLNPARLDNPCPSLNDRAGHASGFRIQSGGNNQFNITEAFPTASTDYPASIFTSPVITTPEMTRPRLQPDGANFMVTTGQIENRFDFIRFEKGGLVPIPDSDALAPLFSQTTGNPNITLTNQNALLGNHQRHDARNHTQLASVPMFPETTGIPHFTQDVLLGNQQSTQVTRAELLQNYPQYSPSAALNREPSSSATSFNQAGVSYLQPPNIPHIAIEGETSPQAVDATSPLSSPSTGYSPSRPPRSPSNNHVTKATTENAFCEVTNPRRDYDKIQKKFLLGPRRSEQRIQNGIVRLKVLTKMPLGDPAVSIFVRREPMAAQKQFQEHPAHFTMQQVRIPDVRTWLNNEYIDTNYSFGYNCELNLDSVYLTDDEKEVYKLVKSKGAINNLFQLWLVLIYNNGDQETLMPYEFVLKSGRTPTQSEHQMDGGSGIRDTIVGPKSDVSCRYLQAESAKITNIHCEYIQTDNHDIAYFMRVQCQDDSKPTDLEKGDVVAFLEDDEGDTYIDFLTSDNAHEARLAGVISRTAFFQGRKAICDPDHVDSDLVCIIGEVDVKVQGKVRAGDLIFTSNCLLQRGTAIARSPIEPESYTADTPRPTLLGMAMESYCEEEIKLARCLVSIVLGISDLHQRQTLEELRSCNDKIFKMQRWLRGIWKKLLLLFLFFVLTGTVCYLFLAPNSPYLIMKCEKGCIKSNEGSCLYLKFDYFPPESQESDEIIGIYFKWKVLKKKLDLDFIKVPNATDFRYFLNKNRCVTGGIRAISSWLDSTPQIPRVNVLAVKSNCSHIFYHSARDGWVAYRKRRVKVKKCDEY